MTYKAPFQPSLDNMDVRQDASLDDFTSTGYAPILTAIEALCQGKISELFIIGDEGVGKTHLAIAILNHYSKKNPNVVCLSLSEVINSGDDVMVLAGLETFDLIILDDVQSVCGHDEWEEGLFHLINRIREQQKNLIFIADNPSIDLAIHLPDLKTRLSTPPAMRLPTGDDIEDKIAIIHAILRRKNWRLPDEILSHLIHQGPQNAKDIVSVLDGVSPLLTHLSRVQVPKKIIEEAKQLIDHETLSLEITRYTL